MPTAPIWILEDDPNRAEQMLRLCARWNGAVAVFRTAEALLVELARGEALPAVLSLDHDLNHTVAADSSECGMWVIDRLVADDPFASVLVHSSNADAAATMTRRLTDAGWPVARVNPYDDLFWLDAEWIEKLGVLLAAAVLGGGAGLLLVRTQAVSELLAADAADCLGVVRNSGVVELFRASPITDALGSAFRGHDDLVRSLAIDRRSLIGGFSLFTRDGRLSGLSRRSALNDPSANYRLPMTLVDDIIHEIGLPRDASFRVFG